MTTVVTPLMQQYREIKSRHQDAILFFRMGEFYEMFYDDAETASRMLGLTLTSRNNGGASDVPLAGVPVKAAADYVRRLVQQGFRVAICEQVEDPRLAKGIVRREVIETVTPGAAFADDLLDGARNNYICAIAVVDEMFGVAAADISTGELRLAVVDAHGIEPLLARLAPRELLVSNKHPDVGGAEGALTTEREGWEFDVALARDDIARHFGVLSLDGLGIGSEDAAAVGAAGALLRYLKELQPAGVSLARPIIERPGGVMPLDEMTRRNLELVESLRGGAAVDGTLLAVLDRTGTPMGARLLRQWLLAPLANKPAIDARLEAVATLRRRRGRARDHARRRRRRARRRTPRGESRGRPQHAARAPRARRLAVRVARRPRLIARRRRRARAGRLGEILRAWDDAAEVGVEHLRNADRERADRRGRRADDRDGRGRRARRAPRAARRRQRCDRAHPGGRAGAHGHRVAQGRVQQGVRLLHRGHQLEPPPGAAATISGGRRSRRASGS